MSTTINILDLPSRFAEAIAVASSGEDVFVTDGAAMRARLVPFEYPSARKPGLHQGAMSTAEDFDVPLLDDFWNGQT